jgi:hypothetical protein
MKKRIKELAAQVGIEFTYDPTETPMRSFVECWEDELSKFAELIVKECLILAQIDENQFNAAGYTSQAEGSFSVGLAIKEHFGVK